MSADSSHPSEGEEWFQPDTYSVWLWDREGEGKPIFLVLYEWEIATLCGLLLWGAWGDVHDLNKSTDDWEPEYRNLLTETVAPERMTSLELAQLIRTGQLHRIGSMPKLNGYIEPAVQGDAHLPRAASSPPEGG